MQPSFLPSRYAIALTELHVHNKVVCKVGNDTYPVMDIGPIGATTFMDEHKEQRITSATTVVRFIGAQWMARQDLPGIIYWIPTPAMDITREMKRIRHDLAEWHRDFEDPVRREAGKIGFRALQIMMEQTGYDLYVSVSSYPKEDIRVMKGRIITIGDDPQRLLLLEQLLYPQEENDLNEAE